jgi:S1-C subfamily serine protease
VECHLIGDFQNIQREQEGTLDKLTQLYRSPDIKTIGIHLDVPKGLVVKEALGAVQAAGMKPGDRITKWNGTPVWTFGDVQYRYDKVDRQAKQVRIAVDRDGRSPYPTDGGGPISVSASRVSTPGWILKIVR